MKVFITHALAIGAICALVLGVGGAASAQDYHHPMMHHPMPMMHHSMMPMGNAMEQLRIAQAEYARAKRHGNVEAMHRAHMKASMIRRHMRMQMHHPYMHHPMMMHH